MISQIGAPSGSIDRLRYRTDKAMQPDDGRPSRASLLPIICRSHHGRNNARRRGGTLKSTGTTRLSGHQQSTTLSRENTNADATQYDACLHRSRSDHEQQNRLRQSGAASDAGEFRRPRRRLRLPHPYPSATLQKFPFFAGRVYTPELASPEEMTALHKALHMERVVIVTPSDLRPRQFADAVRHGGARRRPRAGSP